MSALAMNHVNFIGTIETTFWIVKGPQGLSIATLQRSLRKDESVLAEGGLLSCSPMVAVMLPGITADLFPEIAKMLSKAFPLIAGVVFSLDPDRTYRCLSATSPLFAIAAAHAEIRYRWEERSVFDVCLNQTIFRCELSWCAAVGGGWQPVVKVSETVGL